MEIISRICMVFKGYTLDTCLDMTPDQLRLVYSHTFIQEARSELRLLNLLILSKARSKDVQEALVGMKIQAFPPDIEEDNARASSPQEVADELSKLLGKGRVRVDEPDDG